MTKLFQTQVSALYISIKYRNKKDIVTEKDFQKDYS